MSKISIRDDGTIHIEGYVNAVERYSRELYEDNKKFFEKVKAGAFTSAIERAKEENRPIYALFNHDSSKVLNDNADGDLELEEDNIGLHCKFTISPNNKNYQEVRNSIDKDKLQGFSFCFTQEKDSWDDEKHRILENFELIEVSLLNCTPAYYGTTVSARDKDSKKLHFRNEIVKEEEDVKMEMQEILVALLEEIKALNENMAEQRGMAEDIKELKEALLNKPQENGEELSEDLPKGADAKQKVKNVAPKNKAPERADEEDPQEEDMKEQEQDKANDQDPQECQDDMKDKEDDMKDKEEDMKDKEEDEDRKCKDKEDKKRMLQLELLKEMLKGGEK